MVPMHFGTVQGINLVTFASLYMNKQLMLLTPSPSECTDGHVLGMFNDSQSQSQSH